MTTDRTVRSADGVELAVRDHGGDGPDVLFLHGRSRTLVDWPPVLEHLPGIRAAAMDFRWHGGSDVGGSVSIDALIADIDAVGSALAMERPVLVGHSMGGVIATYFAAAHDRCAAVLNIDGLDTRMLDDPPPLSRAPTRRAGADHGDMAWYLEEVERMHRAEDEFGVPENIADAYIERALVEDPDGTWHRRPPRAFYELGLGADTNPYDVALAEAKCPVVVLLCTGRPKTPSERDEPMTAVREAMLRKLTPLADVHAHVRVETIDGSHAVIWEKPDEIACIVRSLL
jgi:pimeloyl-ACP methyl ester carboxylesterase